MMNFTYKIGSVNLNSSNSLVNKQLLKDFIYINDLDVIFLQEVSYDNFSFIPSHAPIVNLSDSGSGTAILIRKTFDFSSPLLDPNGRISSVIINHINFINVYAFLGTNRKKERDDLFLDNMTIHLNKAGSKFCVVGGDFNCILNAFDTAGSNKNYSTGLKRLIEIFNFKDIAVELRKHQFTFYRGDTESRLDRFYAPSAFLENVLDFTTLPVAFSDHHAIIMKIKSCSDEFSLKGRGYWKINSTIANDSSVSDQFSECFETWKLRHQYTDDKNLWWNVIAKKKFKQFYQNKSWELNQQISN